MIGDGGADETHAARVLRQQIEDALRIYRPHPPVGGPAHDAVGASARATPLGLDQEHRAHLGMRGHDLRTRRSGSQKFIDLHLEVERDMLLQDAHDVTVRVLRDIEAEVPRARVHIHTDPAG